MEEKEIINELLSIEHFALTCESNARTLRQKATQLRKRLGDIAPAALDGGLTIQQRSDLVAGRMKSIIRKRKSA